MSEQVLYKKTSTYSSWANMKTRCLNPKDPHYARWGGTVDTTIKLGALVKVGATVHYGRRYNENCTGPLMKDLRRTKRRR